MAARLRVEEDRKRGNGANISGTPALYLNGTFIDIADMNVPTLKGKIDAELQKAAPQNPPALTGNAGNSNK
jgi:protein-disulfide isomerase